MTPHRDQDELPTPTLSYDSGYWTATRIRTNDAGAHYSQTATPPRGGALAMNDTDSDIDDISLVSSPTERILNPRQQQDYPADRDSCVRWLLTSGKDPDKHDGYALSTVKTRARRMAQFYRWVWDHERGYSLKVTTDHADAWMTHLAQQDSSGAHKSNCQKAIQSLFKWRHHERGAKLGEPSISFSGSTAAQPRDYLTREERPQIREAALEYGCIPSYSNLNPSERDRWRSYLAQRFQKPKDIIKPSDWDRANGWKIPSLVWTSLDAGLRPIEIERARPS